MIRILLLFAVLGLSACATARPRVAQPHPDETAILAVVDRFMHAISANDTALLSELRLEGGFTIVERPSASGGTVVTRRVFKPEGGSRGAYRERYWDPTVLVRGSLAVVWTPYEFWIDGKTSHCGIDVFDMLKEPGSGGLPMPCGPSSPLRARRSVPPIPRACGRADAESPDLLIS